MRARISGGVFLLGVLLLTVDPVTGQPGGGKFGKGGFTFQPGGQPGGFGQPGAQPGGFGQPGGQPGGFGQPGGGRFGQPGGQPGGFGQPGAQPGGFGQQGGGQQGGGFGRGGGGMDPETQWLMMLKVTGGTDSLDFSRIPPESRQFLRGLSEKMGTPPLPESGVWNKAQFVEFATRNQEIVRAKMAEAQQPGGGFGQQPGGFGQQPGGGRGGPGGFQMTDEDMLKRFRDMDLNQDGRVTYEESNGRTRDSWREVDVNGRGYIEFDDYKAYVQRRLAGTGQPGGFAPGGFGQPGFTPGGFGGPQGDPQGDPRGGGNGNGRGDKKAEDFSNIAIRYGKLPPGLPDWFAEYDTDKDGQINMYEWRTVGGKTVVEFRELDANGDGLIAPQELVRVTALKTETDRLIAIQEGETPQGSRGSKGGSMSSGGSKGGFPGFGGAGGGGPPGGFGNKGGGDAKAPDARPSREEKRDEKSAPNPFRSGGKKGS